MSAQNPWLPISTNEIFADAVSSRCKEVVRACGQVSLVSSLARGILILCFVLSKSLFCESPGKISPASRPEPAGVPQARISSTQMTYSIVDGADIRFSRPDGPQGLSLTKLGPVVQD